MFLQNQKRALRAALAVFACLVLSGCLSMKSYVDPALPVVKAADIDAPASPATANLLYEFRTKGNANARATTLTRGFALSAANESGVFTRVIEGAGAPADGQLTIVIDNVPVTDNAAAKGFGTGLTLGLAGSIVTDGYVCTARYVRGSDPVKEVVLRHSLHTTIGNKSGPEGLTAVTMDQGVETVVKQLVLNALKQLADDGAFGAP